MNIIIWQIGQLNNDHPLLPTQETIERLEDKIEKHFNSDKKNEDFHVVCGPEGLKVQVISVPNGPVQNQFQLPSTIFPAFHYGT